MMSKLRNRFFKGALALLLTGAGAQHALAFTHPCILLNDADLTELNSRKNTVPYAAGYALFLKDNHSQLSYVMKGPVVEVGRSPWLNQYTWRNDLLAIYGLALQWKFTGNSAYAEKAKGILLAWANTHTKWSGIEPYLELGDYAHYLCTGASILRSYPGWTAANTATVKKYFNDVHWPAATAAIPLRSANQGGAHLVAAMCLAVYLDDMDKFNQVVTAFRSNGCTGLLTTQPDGQIGDSGRDQGHAYGELWHYAITAEVAWKAAGLDLFSLENERLRACAEYWAQYNNGGHVPWIKAGTCYNLWTSGPNGAPHSSNPEAQHIFHAAYVVRQRESLPNNDAYAALHPDDWRSWTFRRTVDHSTAKTPAPLTFPSTAAVTAGLTVANIGGANPAGSASYNGGTWTVKGAGADIWGGADSFVFAYKTLTGDAALIARVTGVQSTNAAAKVGVMIRENLTSDSKMAVLAEMPSAAGDVATGRGYTAVSHYNPDQRHAEATLPYWLKIERRGNRVSVFDSPNGTNWTPVKVFEFSMSNTYLIGLGVASHANGTLNTATFTDVSITGGNSHDGGTSSSSSGSGSSSSSSSSSSGGSTGGSGTLPNGTYSIRNRASGKLLDNLGTTNNGDPVGQWTDTNSPNQQWIVTQISGNDYKVRCVTGGNYLDTIARTTNGSPVGQWDPTGSTNQQWNITRASTGYYHITNVATNKALDTAGSTIDGGAIKLNTSTTAATQEWQFVAP